MRQRIWLALLVVSLWWAWWAPALGQPKGDHPPAGKGSDQHADKKDINIFEPRFDLGIWTVVVFLGLFFVLKKYAWGPMMEGLQKREERIKGALEEAKKTREETEKIRAELEKKMNEAAQTIAGMMEEARRDANQLLADAKAQGIMEIQAERDRLRREIQTATDQALLENFQKLADLAALISVKATRKHLSAEDHRQLVNEALEQLKAAGEQRRRELNL
jgi:F-type H+-transporting ATPase subunit b